MSKLISKTKSNFRGEIVVMFHCALALDALRTNKVNSSPRRSLRVAELVVVVRILLLLLLLLRWFSSSKYCLDGQMCFILQQISIPTRKNVSV